MTTTEKETSSEISHTEDEIPASEIQPQQKEVEKFGGKIVYKPSEQSAYIIDGLNEDVLIEDEDKDQSSDLEKSASVAPKPISNAVYITKSAAYYNTLYGNAAKILRDRLEANSKGQKEDEEDIPPVVHSYKVVSLRQNFHTNSGNGPPKLPPSCESFTRAVPVKPILMCFICKLSFGFAKSFETHAKDEHGLELTEDERRRLETKNASAILQTIHNSETGVSESLVSFLEPLTEDGTKETQPPLVEEDEITEVSEKDGEETSNKDKSGEEINGDDEEGNGKPKGRLSPSSLKGILSAALSGRPLTSTGISVAGGLFPPPAPPPPLPPLGGSGPPGPRPPPGSLEEMLSAAFDPANLPLPPPNIPGLPPLPLRNPFGPPPPGSPGVSASLPSPSPNSIPSNANMLQGTTIGACPEHVNGRQDGVECAKCDIILNRIPGGGLGWNAARNSCKTLKCPKCNWHYKYQETLEIHMKEKHPEAETTCIYCLTNQAHPRLARGETYTCGYKPYRCEVCSYSTTTKGNLSIHMQSDKHLNNMQELQNGGTIMPSQQASRQNPFNVGPGGPINPSKQIKPNWRCDICNYETNVARNLRIHMTSEKHTHNIMVLQQNVKHMQNIAAMAAVASGGNPPTSSSSGGLPPLPLPAGIPPFPFPFPPNKNNSPGSNGDSRDSPNPLPPPGAGAPPFDPQLLFQMMSSLAGNGGDGTAKDMPDSSVQALMMQMLAGGAGPTGSGPPGLPGLPPNLPGLPPLPPLPPTSGASPANLAAQMLMAANMDDSPIDGPFGGDGPFPGGPPLPPPALDGVDPNPRFIYGCTVCKEFGTDSIEQLSHHLTLDRTKGREHEVSIIIAGNFICKLCTYKTNLKANFQLHCKTDKHLQKLNHVNHIKEGGPSNEWKVKFLNVTNPVQIRCNTCDYYTNSLHKLQLHASNQRHEISVILFNHLRRSEIDAINNRGDGEDNSSTGEDGGPIVPPQNLDSHKLVYRCCLCNFDAPGKVPLMCHVRTIKHLQMEQMHQIQKRTEGKADQTEIGDIFKVLKKENADDDNIAENDNNGEDGDENSIANNQDKAEDEEGQNMDTSTDEAIDVNKEPSSTSPTPPGSVVSEKHLYKYRCNQCSLAFKTADKLALHSQYHAIRDSSKCKFCSRSFRSVQALLRHIETGAHEGADASKEELAHYKLGLMNHPLLLAGLTNLGNMNNNENSANNEDSIAENEEDDNAGKSSGVNKPGDANQQHRKNFNYPMEKYLDPNRPYKCDVCKESFTQKNILLVHYNSVSHLHRLKKNLKSQQQQQQSPEKPSSGSSLENAINNLRNRSASKQNEDDSKPYKCNICKVSYAQGSTLDIHVRSVLHQTRASKLQELAMTGQVDLSKPLIEQPSSQGVDFEGLKKNNDLLMSPVGSTGSPSQVSPGSPQMGLPLTPTSSPLTKVGESSEMTPQQQQLAKILQALNNKNQQKQNEEEKETEDSESAAGGENGNILNSKLQFLQQIFKANNASSAQENNGEKKMSGLELVMQNLTNERNKKLVEEQQQKEKEKNDMAKNGKENRENNSEETESEPDAKRRKSQQNEEISSLMTPEKSVDEGPSSNNVDEAKDEKDKPTTDMQAVFQQAILAAQQQSQTINPLLLQMTQMQGMNPLVAMNLQPPLVPPSLLQSLGKPPSSSDSGPPGPANFLTNILSSLNNPPSSEASPKLGDPKGLDLKAMMGMMDPKNATSPSPFPSPSGLKGLSGLGDKPPNLPLNPDPKFLAQLAQMGGGANSPGAIRDLSKQILDQQGPMGAPPGSHLPHPPPPLPFMGMMPGLLPTSAASSPGGGLISPSADPKGLLLKQQQPPMFSQPEQAKRARTRITDDQLKVLRSYFDINNSPTEEAVNTMVEQTGLPPKVIKHWFRNTLFKERQRSKDSPYNFNNPPSTTLNLEEYEKTGKSNVTQLSSDNAEAGKENKDDSSKNKDEDALPQTMDEKHQEHNRSGSISRSEHSATPKSDIGGPPSCSSPIPTSFSMDMSASAASNPLMGGLLGKPPFGVPAGLLPHPMLQNFPGLPTSLAGPLPNFLNPLMMGPGGPLDKPLSPQLPRSPTPSSMSGGCNLGPQGKRANRTRFTDYQIKVLQEFFENNAYPKDDDLEYLSKLLGLSPRVIVVWFQNARQKARKIYENQPPLDPTDDGTGRFTRTPGLNYQCKKCLLVFQRYYELIRHQKQHCFKEEDAKRSALAQKAAAQAAAQFSQQAAGMTSSSSMNNTSTHSEDSNSSYNQERNGLSPMVYNSFTDGGARSRSFDGSDAESPLEPSPFRIRTSISQGAPLPPPQAADMDGGKKLTPSMFDQLTKIPEPPLSGPPMSGPPMSGVPPMSSFNLGGLPPIPPPIMTQASLPPHGPGSTLFPSYPPASPFSLLHQQALQSLQGQGGPALQIPPGLQLPLPQLKPSSQENKQDSDDGDEDSLDSSPSNSNSLKRKLSGEEGDFADENDDGSSSGNGGQSRDKRLRTTILPEQLDFLYQKYQLESNPSRKMLEQIANEVGLRKRVVQVWFQNTRARERKGQFRAHQQVINKRCPFCPALFRVRSALESHLATKHADQFSKGDINIDNLPDAEAFDTEIEARRVQLQQQIGKGGAGGDNLSIKSGDTENQSFNPGNNLEESMRKYYEDTMKRYMNDLQGNKEANNIGGGKALDLTSIEDKDSSALDLTGNEESISNIDVDEEKQQPTANGGPTVNKRFSSEISEVQIKIMKILYINFKNPTMSECTDLGKEIGLQKRVVQVWFQNARAKEKKAQGGSNTDELCNSYPSRCSFCLKQFENENREEISKHYFSSSHIEAVTAALENGGYEPKSPGGGGGLDNGNNSDRSSPALDKDTPLSQQQQHLLMQHMIANSNANNATALPPVVTSQAMAAGSPFAPGNPFLHPAMFSAQGK